MRSKTTCLSVDVVPMAISAMQKGTTFCFKCLLVQNESCSVSVPYTQNNVVVSNTVSK